MTTRPAATLVSLHAAATAAVVLCAAQPLPAGDAVPEWVHLLPAGPIATGDGRGPYTAPSLQQLAASSLKAGERLPIDENHATDLAAPRGEPAPARGWIVELQARSDGLWGRVEWTPAGRDLVAGKSYRGISPALRLESAGSKTIAQVLRASLTNVPNLRGLTALHMETPVEDFLAQLRQALGLPETADATAIVAAIEGLKKPADKGADKGGDAPALQAQLAAIGKAAGAKDGADGATILTAVTALADPTKSPTVVALQAAVTELTGRLNTITADTARKASEAVIDAAIREGRVGINQTNRGQIVELHQTNPARIDAWIAGLPKLSGGVVLPAAAAAGKDGAVSLNAEQTAAAKALGIDPKDYAKTLQAETAAA